MNREPVQQSIYQDFASLLASTQQLLAGAEPSLADWQDYAIQRKRLFERSGDISAVCADSGENARNLRRLIAAVLEQDEFLMQEIRRHVSKIGREMTALTDRRRLFHAYVSPTRSPRSGYLRTA